MGEATGTVSNLPAFLTIVMLTIILLRWLRRSQEGPRLPPGPWGVPLLGCIPFLKPNLHHYFANLAKVYGPVLSLRLGTKLYFAVTSPAATMDILHTHDAVFANRAVTVTGLLTPGDGENLLMAPNGPLWRSLRKIAVQDMLSVAAMDSFQPLRRQEIQRMLSKMVWEGALKEERGRELREILEGMLDILGSPNISDFVPALTPFDLQGLQRRMKKMRARLNSVLDPIIEERYATGFKNREDGGARDFLQMLLDIARRNDSDLPLQSKHVKALLTDVIFAGTHTSSITTEWVLAELVRHPEVMAKVREELDAVVGRGNAVEEVHVSKLEYLDAVMSETLRLHPVVSLLITRQPSESREVGGYVIPKGANVVVNFWAIHRDPSVWEEPLEFRPERFLENKGRWLRNGKSFEYMPFGAGRRICAGMVTGERMVKYAVGSLVHLFNWELPAGAPPVDDEDKFMLTTQKKNPLVLVPLERDPKP